MRALVPAVLLSAAVAASGCGGDDRLSREELVAQADAVCAGFEAELEGLAQPESLQDAERLLDDARPILEDSLAELRGLEPPADLEAEYDEWISRTEENLGELDELGEAVDERDEGRIGEILQRIQQNEEQADRLAAEIGLEDCAAD